MLPRFENGNVGIEEQIFVEPESRSNQRSGVKSLFWRDAKTSTRDACATQTWIYMNPNIRRLTPCPGKGLCRLLR